jgi:hypothetical protein
MEGKKTVSDIEFVILPRNDRIADLIRQCAEGKLPFSGPDSLCFKMRQDGYNTNGLYEMVKAAEASLEKKSGKSS